MFILKSAGKVNYLCSVTVEVIMRTPQDALDILAQDYGHGTGRFLLHETNFVPEFYDLKTGLAGEILQKFSNYSVKAAILGNFAAIVSPRFKEFMYECNRGKQLRFIKEEPEAVRWLGQATD